MRDVDSHRSRRFGQLPFLVPFQRTPYLYNQMRLVAEMPLGRSRARTRLRSLETYYGDAIRFAIAYEA